MKETSSPSLDGPRFRVGRYLMATLATGAWVMLGALHLPVDLLMPDLEYFFYPSFIFFMPLSILYGRWLPWPTNTMPAQIVMMLLDVVLMAVLCLPFLFPKGRKQDVASLLSLLAIAGYTIVSMFSYLMKSF